MPAATERLPHPDDNEFREVRADLGRLYLRHRHDLALSMPDDEIVRRVDDITRALIIAGKMARANGDTRWLLRHKWWFAATARLFDNGDAVPLDG